MKLLKTLQKFICNTSDNPTMNRAIINTCLHILKHEFGLSSVQIIEHLKQKDYSITQSELTKAPSIIYKKGEWISKKYVVGTKHLQYLRKGLLQILEDIYNIHLIYSEEKQLLQEKHTLQTWVLIDKIPDSKKYISTIVEVELKPNLDLSKVLDLMKHANEIWVLQTYLSSIDQLDNSLKEAIKNNSSCKIKILLLDPNQEAAHLREKGLSNKKYENVIQKIHINIGELEALKDQFPGNIEYALYEAIPGFAMYRIDEYIFLGFQWFHKFNREGSFIEFRFDENHHLSRDIMEHWEGLWQYASGYHNKERFDLTFTCYFQYDDEIRTMELLIDTETKDAALINTPSKKDYFGNLINLQRGYCSIHLMANNNLRVTYNAAFFMINLDYDDIKETEIATGIYTVNSPVDGDKVFARKVLLENKMKVTSESLEIKEKAKEGYLQESVLINEQFAVKTWNKLTKLLRLS